MARRPDYRPPETMMATCVGCGRPFTFRRGKGKRPSTCPGSKTCHNAAQRAYRASRKQPRTGARWDPEFGAWDCLTRSARFHVATVAEAIVVFREAA